MSTTKPIRVFAINLTGTWEFWATQHYRERRNKDGEVVGYEVTGKKYNVTQDIAHAIVHNDIEFVQESTP